jgi:hypothetical protein
MIEIVILIVFFVGLVVGAIVTDRLGWLPSTEALQEEDRTRFRKLEHET